MKLDASTWKEFCLEELFEVSGTKTTKPDALNEYSTGEYPYITTKSTDNAVSGYYDFYTENGNVLTIDSAVTGFCSYQAKNFSASDHVEKLTPKFVLNRHIALFLTTIVNQERYKYSYGRKCNQKKIRNTIIKLPATSKNKPDWDFMERYIRTLRHKPITTKIKPKHISTLKIDEWKEFLLDDLFTFHKGKRLTKQDMIEGHVNFLGAISENNGIRQLIDIEPMYETNCVTVNYNGSVGEAFYQSTPFWASDDVNILYAKNWTLNKYIALFIATVIKANRYKFSYGRKWTLDKMKESPIKLPITAKGEPDWDYMERYIKALPYSDKI